MIKDILLVGAGSFIGGAARYAVSLLMRSAEGFPWGTFTVNMIGCFLIGILGGWMVRQPNISPAISLFLSVGFCGGFTTFSTFSKESLALLQSCHYIPFALYAIGSVALGIICVAIGYIATK